MENQLPYAQACAAHLLRSRGKAEDEVGTGEDFVSDTRKTLRKFQTDAESLLWWRLRNRQLGNFKFRRQHPFPPYIVDFVCLEKKLIVEVDGGQHVVNRRSDERRTQFLESQGFQVIRFWNHEVLQEIDVVLDRILSCLSSIE